MRMSALPLLTMACHCRGCQRMTASAYSLTAMFPIDNFTIAIGEPVIGGLHSVHRHYFCPYCMSWLFTRPHGVDQFVNVRPTMLDDVSWFAPFIETYVSERLPWANTPASYSFDEFPRMEEYANLVAEYAIAASQHKD